VAVDLLVLSQWSWLRWRVPFAVLLLTVLSPGVHFAVQATVEQRRAEHATA
jgi:hypothetical protein